MARPIVHTRDLQRELLQVAAVLTATKGADSWSLREVASKSGTSTTAIYSLFGGKKELLNAVIEEGFVSFTRAQELASLGGLIALCRAYRQWALANPVLYSLMFAGPHIVGMDCPPSVSATSPALAPLVQQVSAVPNGESATTAVVGAIWGQVHGLVSLELSGIPPISASWEESYETAIAMIGARHGAH